MEKARLIETLEAMKEKDTQRQKRANENGLDYAAYGYACEIGMINIFIGMLESDEYAEKIRAEYIKEGE